jgi:hypothetical protein
MRVKTLVGLASSGALACLGAVGLSGVAYGAAAQHPPVSDVPIIYPSPDQSGEIPPPGPGSPTTVTGDCPSYLFGTAVGLSFQSGNVVEYRIPPGAPPGVSNGANGEGIADLIIATAGSDPTPDNPSGTLPSNPIDSLYSGQAHLWFGQNFNANGHSYFGETFTFHGTAPNGATIDLHGNPGFNMSAGPGNPNQWGKVGITCTGTPFPLPSS